ncbi:hypothetical protein OJ996_15310 [Luteolibacter sp. GHJ8]|uniref:Thrombospondin type 3 repeat-containing protein n=1 Tax=Luteolibacter rhizosphaerae TaxID=2989719 RepID=A0ABT3G618_9BACT|nr:hypothetical protein [Luteolibacter rhizosphaerae]MCW1914956.1 hypothetical protein [Luteolibacter rhizosphaerae]
MKLPPRSSLFLLLLSCVSPLHAGERFIVNGYAKQVSGGVVVGLNPVSDPVLALASPPLDRYFVPPGRVRWEVELTGGMNAAGVPLARALGTAPADYAWPAGDEMSPARFAGASNAMNPFENTADPLGVTPGGPPDYDQDGVPDEVDAFPGDPAESVDSDGDGIGNHADPDDDNDSMPDVWELQYGLNPLLADGDRDADFDGFTNFQEYEADTNPRNGSSLLKVNISKPTPGSVRLTWMGRPGRSYSIWRLPTLSLTPEPAILNLRAGSSSAMMSQDFPLSGGKCFYFLKAEIAPAP